MNLRLLVLLLASLLVTAALAGCADDADEAGDDGLGDGTPPEDDTPTGDETPADVDETPPDNETPTDGNETPAGDATAGAYVLDVGTVPTIVTAGNPFLYDLSIQGPEGTASEIGAYYAAEPMTTPDASQMQACATQTGATLPGTFNLTCTIEEAGEWTVYGRALIGEGADAQELWTEPITVTAYQYALSVEQGAGENEFTLSVTGTPEGQMVEDAGIYYTTQATVPTSTADVTACTGGGAEEVPATITATCDFPGAGTYYVYGHFKVVDGQWVESFWSAPLQVTVA